MAGGWQLLHSTREEHRDVTLYINDDGNVRVDTTEKSTSLPLSEYGEEIVTHRILREAGKSISFKVKSAGGLERALERRGFSSKAARAIARLALPPASGVP